MTPSQLFEVWAPRTSIWSAWAKPVLFADPGLARFGVSPNLSSPPGLRIDDSVAVIADLPGAESIHFGLELAKTGHRPVPCFNGAPGPALDVANSAVVDVVPIVAALSDGAESLARLSLADQAPPVFLIDAHRRPEKALAQPGRFDNRWVVFPQDFPSAKFLQQHGIRSVLLIQRPGRSQPQSDLAHVLLRWQQEGLPLFVRDVGPGSETISLKVNRPSQFRRAWYRALVILGLRRHSAGGFGSIVPEPSSSGG